MCPVSMRVIVIMAMTVAVTVTVAMTVTMATETFKIEVSVQSYADGHFLFDKEMDNRPTGCK